MAALTIDPYVLTPSAEVGTAESYPDFFDRVIAAINDHADLINTGTISGFLTPEQFGAVGDGETNDRPAFVLAVAALAALGGVAALKLGADRSYWLSESVQIDGTVNFQIWGNNAEVIFPSDDASLTASGGELAAQQRRSAFYIHNSRDFSAREVRCRGTGTNITVAGGSGAAFAFRRCANSALIRCIQEDGGSLYIQDAVNDSSGTGDSIAISGTTCTISDAAGSFHAGMIGATIVPAGCTNNGNNGGFKIKTVNSAGTQVTYTNAAGVNETSSFTWTVFDGDRKTLLLACHQRNPRSYNSFARFDTTVINCTAEYDLAHADASGMGDSYTISGTTVTLKDDAGKFKPWHHGKYIKTASSTSPANDIVAQLTYISSTQVSFTNASGVTEAFTGTWWIMGGERTGLGTSFSVSGSTVTLTLATNAVSSADIGKAIEPRNPTSSGNRGAFTIEGVPAPNQVTFTNASGVTEAFTGVWTIDSYDNTVDSSSNTNGSTHTWYGFAGRENIKLIGCTITGNRTTGMKFSGTSLPVRDVTLDDCSFIECAVAIIFGADDVNEHSGLLVNNCRFTDCTTNRQGWGGAGSTVAILGSQGVVLDTLRFHYSRPTIGQVNGVGNGGAKGIEVSRYVAGKSQPVEDLIINDVKFTTEPGTTSRPIAFLIQGNSIGLRAKWGTCTLNRASNIVTVTVSGGLFAATQDIGKTIALKNTGIDGTYTVLSVPTQGTFTIASAGADGSISGGTYRMSPRSKSTTCQVRGVVAHDVASTGVYFVDSVCPTVVDMDVSGLLTALRFEKCAWPFWDNIRDHGRGSQSASLRVDSGCSWPIAGRAVASNGGLSTSYKNMGIAVDNSVAVDYPICGTHGKAKPTGALEQVVIAWGSNHVDGDVLNVNGTALTFKTSAPGATEFNSFASLLTAIAAVAGGATYTAVDYGSQFTDACTTQHILISKTAQTTSDGTFFVSSSALNPTALVVLSNDSTQKCYSRGAGSAGPTADKTVVWSPCCDWQRPTTLVATNTSAKTLLAGSYFHKKNSGGDSGCCDLLQHGTSAGTEEIRWLV